MREMSEEIQKKRGVLITGASGGIGRAIALRLLSEGYSVAACYNKNDSFKSDLEERARAHSTQVRFLQLDVTDRVGAEKKLLADIESHEAYYGVVCNAGVTRDNPFPAVSGDDWDTVLRTNLDSFYNILHPVVMPMIQTRQPGRIVTVGSVSGVIGNRGQTNYSASKAGLIGATKALAIELGKRDITVNCVVPGIIETDMVSEEILAHVKPLIALKRPGKPEDVASAVCFLLSKDASYITKQTLCVDGGMV